MHCIKCGKQLPERGKFCWYCGRPVDPPPARPSQIGFARGVPVKTGEVLSTAPLAAASPSVTPQAPQTAQPGTPRTAAPSQPAAEAQLPLPAAEPAAAPPQDSSALTDVSTQSALFAALIGDVVLDASKQPQRRTAPPAGEQAGRPESIVVPAQDKRAPESAIRSLLGFSRRRPQRATSTNIWRVALYSAFGAAGGALFFRVFIGPTGGTEPESWLLWLFSLGILFFITNDLIEPLLTRRRAGQWAHEHRAEIRLGIVGVRGTLGIVLVAVGAEIYKSMVLRNIDLAFFWATTVLITGALTYAWIKGVAAQPSQAGRDGQWAGGIAGGVTGLALIVFMAARVGAAPASEWGDYVTFLATNLLIWSVAGLFGGWGIDRLKGSSLMVRFWAGAGLSLIPRGFWAAWQVHIGVLKNSYTSPAQAILHSLLTTVGWCIGLWLCPPSDAIALPPLRQP